MSPAFRRAVLYRLAAALVHPSRANQRSAASAAPLGAPIAGRTPSGHLRSELEEVVEWMEVSFFMVWGVGLFPDTKTPPFVRGRTAGKWLGPSDLQSPLAVRGTRDGAARRADYLAGLPPASPKGCPLAREEARDPPVGWDLIHAVSATWTAPERCQLPGSTPTTQFRTESRRYVVFGSLYRIQTAVHNNDGPTSAPGALGPRDQSKVRD